MQQLVDLAKSCPKIAYLYAAVGNSCVALNQILFKQISRYITPFQALYYRSIVLIFINLLLMRREKKSGYIAAEAVFRSVVLRITFVAGSTTGMYQCLKYLPVSTVGTIWNMGPIFIFFIEAFHYKTALHGGNFLLTMISFSGVVLMMQPEFIFGGSAVKRAEDYYVYVGIMMLAALGNAFNMHFIHGLAKKIEPLVNIFYSHLGCAAMSSLLSCVGHNRLQGGQLGFGFFALIAGICVTGFIAQSMIFLANSLERPSLMMPFGYFGVAIGFLADMYLFDTSFTFVMIVGVFLTSGGLLSGYLIQKDKMGGEVMQKSRVQAVEIYQAKRNEEVLGDLMEDERQRKL